MRPLALVAVAAVLLGGGCGSSDGDDAPPGGSPLVQRVSVEEALEGERDGDVLIVEGGLLADGETVRLCSAFAESYPPQCGRPSLFVEGLDLATIDGVETASGISWKEGVSLTGLLRDDVLRIAHGG